MDKQKDILKLEKLAAALYLVTNNFHDNEPIKWQIRDLALKLLSHIAPPNYSLGQVLSPIERLITLSDLAKLNSGASQMNFEIIRQELVALRERIVAREQVEFVESLPTNNLPILPPFSPNRALRAQSHGVVPIKNGPSNGAKNEAVPNGRAEAIYQLIKQRGPISIKDIAQAVPNVSSKTVQRELAALVQTGKLKREGDRRWSRYSII